MPDVITNPAGQTFIFVNELEFAELERALFNLNRDAGGRQAVFDWISGGGFYNHNSAHLIITTSANSSPSCTASLHETNAIDIMRSHQFEFDGLDMDMNRDVPIIGDPAREAARRVRSAYRHARLDILGRLRNDRARVERVSSSVQSQRARSWRRAGGRPGGTTLNALMVLALAILLYATVEDYFSGLPDEGDEEYGRIDIGCDGEITILGNYSDFLEVSRVLRERRDPYSDCASAQPIGIGVTYNANVDSSDVYQPAIRWYVLVPTTSNFPGSGPWACSLTLNPSSLVKPIVTVYSGRCSHLGNNISEVLSAKTNAGCYDFSVETRDHIFVTVEGVVEGPHSTNLAIRQEACLTDPGETCAEAATLSEGVTYGPFTCGPSPEKHWFAVPFIEFSYATITLTVVSASGGNSVRLWRGECETLSETTLYFCPGATVEGTDITTTPGVQGFASKSAHEGDTYVSVEADGEGTVEYTIKVTRGTCT